MQEREAFCFAPVCLTGTMPVLVSDRVHVLVDSRAVSVLGVLEVQVEVSFRLGHVTGM
jgi:hypothetical protein